MNTSDSRAKAAAKALERRRKRQRTATVVVVFAALIGYLVFSFMGDNGEVVPGEYTPTTDPTTDVATTEAVEVESPASFGELRLVLGLDKETGRVRGAVTYAPEGSSLLGENELAAPLSGSTGGTGTLLPDGACAYSDPCQDGLPRTFADDLDGLIDVTNVGPLPADLPHWHRARFACYRSPWLVSDCNLELALGGYGVLSLDGFNDECLAEQYQQRMSFDLSEPSGWWLCDSEWWQAEMPNGAAAACEGALQFFISRAIPQSEVVGSEIAEPGPADQTLPEAPVDAVPVPALVPPDAAERLRYCVDFAAIITSADESEASAQSMRCRAARALLAQGGGVTDRHVPPCGMSLRAPIDTQQLRHQREN